MQGADDEAEPQQHGGDDEPAGPEGGQRAQPAAGSITGGQGHDTDHAGHDERAEDRRAQESGVDVADQRPDPPTQRVAPHPAAQGGAIGEESGVIEAEGGDVVEPALDGARIRLIGRPR
ncbi:hypothetical protein ADENT20671_0575 [Actinomyces denticolens]|uniref:hypothetical protein n=1 Tax=Actinomyces denticolens TaxID=52767 RepID=UPI00098162C4|nr:hypothetical protein [Actinomyces denticolens]GAV93815.1 hypothetical protein ADENT20671_0575 [Actinomyces denticolens]